MADKRERQTGRKTIGELYGGITVSGKDFSEGDRKLRKKQEPSFVSLCKRLYAMSPSMGKGGAFTEENKKAVQFLNWQLSPEEFSGASKIVLMLSLLAAFVAGTLVLFTPLNAIFSALKITGINALLFAYGPFLLGAVGLVSYFQGFPALEARKEQTRALTYVPEIMGYMIMSLKLVPNLEKAVEFSAEHGRGKIAFDLKNLLWETQLGVHNSLSEGLDVLAYRWGEFSDDFKRGLMRIRSSVIENSEAKRYALLDQTMSEMLENIRGKMEQYARKLQEPSTMLFYIGILLPLLLIIILPVGSSFSGAPLANPVVLFFIYNLAIPAVMIVFSWNILQGKPPTYAVPVISDSQKGLPPKWQANIGGFRTDVRFAAIAVLVLGLVLSGAVSSQGIPPKFIYTQLGFSERTPQLLAPDRSRDEVLISAGRSVKYFDLDETGVLYSQYLSRRLRGNIESGQLSGIVEEVKQQVRSDEQIFFSRSENDIAPYNIVFGLLITFSLALFIFYYYSNIYKRKMQLEVQELESGFKDSLYIIASRMAENKPVEEAMKSVQEFMKNSKVSGVFSKTLDNINLLGMPLSQAVFDRNYGSIANIPSSTIQSSMKILVDSVELGVNVAARTLVSLSIQLQNSQKVNELLKTLVSDLTGTMKTMTLFIAPVILGITVSLQRVIIVTMSSIASSNVVSSAGNSAADSLPGGFSGLSVSGLVSPESIANIATPTQFIIIVALYIIELVVIMTYFTTKIEEDNDLLVKINIARFVPVAVIVFVIGMLLSKALVSVAI